MTSGAGVFNPKAKFWFIRSYIAQFNLLVNTPVTQDGRHFTFPDGATPGRNYHVSIRSECYNWSSNRYSLDFFIEDSFYVDAAIGIENPMSYGLIYDFGSFPGLPTLSFQPFALPFTGVHLFRLDQLQPVSYWRPRFP
jgi:hypothetical protein